MLLVELVTNLRNLSCHCRLAVADKIRDRDRANDRTSIWNFQFAYAQDYPEDIVNVSGLRHVAP